MSTEKRKRIRIEIWRPINTKREEERHHYFAGEYLFGLNPTAISKRAYRRILQIVAKDVGGEPPKEPSL